jgi:hypothetical protein
MGRCPHCREPVESAAGSFLMRGELLDSDEREVSVSGLEHVQLHCENCEAVLGYLGVGAATGN